METLLTCLMGLEEYVLKELEKWGYRGKVVGKGRIVSNIPIPLANYTLRTVERVLLLLDVESSVKTLEDIKKVAENIEWDDFLDTLHSFAVRSERFGTHPFRSVDVEREIGGVIVEWFIQKHGKRPPVNLENPWVTVRVDVINDTVYFGLDTTGKALHRRGYRVYEHPASLNATLASALLMESGWKDLLLDPMAGGGTIPIEAYLGKRNIPHFFFRNFDFERWGLWNIWRWRRKVRKKIRWITDDIYGSDLFKKHVLGCRINALSAGAKIKCFQWDASKIHKLPFTPEHIVTNPPYGLRIADPRKVDILYRDFAYSAVKAGSKEIVAISTKWKRFAQYLENAGFDVKIKGKVLYGKLPVRIVIALR